MKDTIGAAIDPRAALEALFIHDREALDKLSAYAAEFNIFEAIGAVRQELRHSKLLSWLLDPSENHGLGDIFLRAFLHAAASVGSKLAPLAIEVMDLDDVDVRREWANIDILVVDHRNALAVIVENKIDSAEHSNQLQRYWATVESKYPGHTVLGIYLTPNGDAPSDGRYLAVGYERVGAILADLAGSPSARLSTAVRTLLEHYARMLRRHIVSDAEIAELCRKLYRKHRHALDLIFEHLPDPRQAVRELFEGLVKERDDLLADDSNRTLLRFAPKQWDAPRLMQGVGWTKSRRMLLFEVVFEDTRVFIKLTIGPGPQEIRQELFGIAHGDPKLFSAAAKTLGPQWNQVYQHAVLDRRALEVDESDQLRPKVREAWDAFLAKDFVAIVAAFQVAARTPLPEGSTTM